MAISVFQNFGVLTPKISKNRFFWKMDPKIQNIQNFQKTVTYVIQLLHLLPLKFGAYSPILELVNQL